MAHTANEIYFNRVTWDSEYKNVVDFGSNAEFGNHIKNTALAEFTILNSTEIRNNTIKVPYNKAYLESRNIDYLTYRNTNHSNRFYGCFIQSMSYINENCTEIAFTLDIWNCFFYNTIFGQCFVEREHINRSEDIVGKNTIAEPVQTGNKTLYYNSGSEGQVDFGSYIPIAYVNSTIYSQEGEWTDTFIRATPQIVKGNLITYNYETFEGTTMEGIKVYEDLQKFIEHYNKNNKINDILAIYFIPEKCLQRTSDNFTIAIGDYIYEGYKPKNKKLYTKQFCSVLVDNAHGDIQELYFEKMGINRDTGIPFTVGVVDYFALPTPAIHYYLNNYEGIPNNYMRSSVIADFPQLQYNFDTFSNFLASNQFSISANILTSALNTILNPTNILSNGVSAITSGSNLLDIANDTPTVKGQQGVTQFNNFLNNNKLKTYAYGLDVESAKRVDDYLSIYGYQTNRVKKPNMSNRNIFNYVKTSNCEITGATADYSKQLSNIFNNGVFIWHDVSKVGNFDIANNG